MLVLLVIGAFALWSSTVTANAVVRADVASRLADDYEQAARAVAGEESLERKYRLEPGAGVLASYDAESTALVEALALVSRDGGPTDLARVATVLAAHQAYLSSSHRMFVAVDAGDVATVLAIDGNEVDPAFHSIEQIVDTAADGKHAVASSALADLRRLELLTSRLTPAVLLVGLLVTAVLASIMRAHRRLLDLERASAIHQSLHDALTGLPNRTLLADRCEQALLAGQRTGATTGLLLIDLDRFKEVNDTFGHHYGDELLTLVGPRLRSVLREQDTVARLGGDEFAVLLPEISGLATATAVAAMLRTALDLPFQLEGVALDVEASIGVVVSGLHGTDTGTLLQHADVAMYVAKSQDRGVSAYDAEVDRNNPVRLALHGDLRRALDLGQLVLHYQPKVGVETGRVVGAEALVRWQHPDRGLIFPDEFIPMAEHTGMITALTTYVLNVALSQARAWIDAGHPLTMSVNLSARDLLDEDLPSRVATLLTAHGVAAELLVLEVTESAIMIEPARARRLLRALDALGVRLSIDDFGAGYTSLGQLTSLPVSELKIDRSFVTTMVEDPRHAVIVHSLVDLGHSLGLDVVAEGVETEAALTALSRCGCDVAQGYLLSRPVPAGAFDVWYEHSRAASLLHHDAV